MAGHGDSFDYVIVGGGSAGCVLANRLSADPNVSVCLIEAGKKDRSVLIHVPLGFMFLLKHKVHNWCFETSKQDGAANRQIAIPRGRTLGGSSSINGMVYMRGQPCDYDEWADTGARGWSYAEVLPYFKRSENNEVFGENEFHGAGGPLNVSQVKKPNKLVDVFLEAADSLQFPRREDFNDDGGVGFGERQQTIKNGRRWSAAQAYLKPVVKRPNLTVILESIADKIVLENGRATGVEILTNGQRRTIKTRKEIILSCGSIISPLILMRSGIGDPAELAKHGIQCKVNSPWVGKQLQEHVTVNVIMKTPRDITGYGFSVPAGPRLMWDGINYIMNRMGMLATNAVEAGGLIKTDPRLEWPDISHAFLPGYRSPNGSTVGYGHGYTMNAVLLRPKSWGYVTLKDADPLSGPVIDPRFFSDPDGPDSDLNVLLKGMKNVRRVLASPAFERFGAVEMKPGKEIQSDDALRAWIRETCSTTFHPVGTCMMGEGERTVVDSELKVKGVVGLRVVDASVMPREIGGNTNAPTIMIAEKASDIILGKPPLPPARVPTYQRQKAA